MKLELTNIDPSSRMKMEPEDEGDSITETVATFFSPVVEAK